MGKMTGKIVSPKGRAKRSKLEKGLIPGRKSAMTPEVLDKLRLAFEAGASDNEACALAGISRSTLYKYQAENPVFLEDKEVLKETIDVKARVKAGTAAITDTRAAQWWLERRRPGEFSQSRRIEATIKHEVSESDVERKLVELLNKYRTPEEQMECLPPPPNEITGNNPANNPALIPEAEKIEQY